MRLSYPLYRLRQLLPTARRVYRQEGVRAFTRQLWRWLRGERRRGRPASDPTPHKLTHWSDWAKAQMSAAPMKAPSLRVVVYIFGSQGHEQTQKSIEVQTRNIQPVWIFDPTLDHVFLLPEDPAEWIIFVRAGAVLNPTIVSQIIETIVQNPDTDVIYGDWLQTFDRQESIPVLRSALVGPLLLTDNVLEPMAVIRADALKAAGGIRSETGEAWFWDIALRLAARGKPWIHLPRLLCQYPHHWPQWEPKLFTSSSALSNAMMTPLASLGLKNIQVDPPNPANLLWDLPQNHRVSIIIPSLDHPELIRLCLGSVLNLTEYDDLEVIVVDTGSTRPETQAVYDSFSHDERFRVIRHVETPFNFSRACNVGAAQATGDLLLFLNNDIEVLVSFLRSSSRGRIIPLVESRWLFHMAKWFALPNTGIVGAQLRFPGNESRIQHMGVAVGFHGVAGHPIDPNIGSSQPRMMHFYDETVTRQMLAVTGACLMISRSVFDAVGGWDEGYQLNFSDVQLCLDVHARDYQVIYAAEARLIHHEGQTHRRRVPRADLVRASEKFAPWLQKGDPSYHPALSYEVSFGLNDDGHTAMDLNRRVMQNLPPDEWIQV